MSWGVRFLSRLTGQPVRPADSSPVDDTSSTSAALNVPRFFRNAAILATAEMVVRFKSLVVIPLLTRHFGEANDGAWAQVAVILAAVGPLATLATENSAMRYLPCTSRSTSALV